MTIDSIIDEVMASQQPQGDTTESPAAGDIEVKETEEAQTEEAPIEEPTKEEKKPDDPRKLENALSKYKGKHREAQEALRFERQRAAQMEQELASYRTAKQTTADEPDEVESYVKKLAATEAEAILQKQLQTIEQNRATERAQADFRGRVQSFKERMPDIEQVLSDHQTVELPPHILEAIKTLPEGPAIAYKLFKDDLLDDLVDLSPVEALMELAELRKSINTVETLKPVTKSPAPLKAAKGTGGVKSALSNNSSIDEVWKWYKG